jgi:hypothetical protein
MTKKRINSLIIGSIDEPKVDAPIEEQEEHMIEIPTPEVQLDIFHRK